MVAKGYLAYLKKNYIISINFGFTFINQATLLF
jgi:hypothetical protein